MPISRSAEPRLVATLGDPAGIGPEVLLKSLAARKKSAPRILLAGNAAFFSALSVDLGLRLHFQDMEDPREIPKKNGAIPCFFKGKLPQRIRRGQSQKELTALAVRSIEIAAGLALKKVVDAVVTPPIHKEGLRKAGFRIPGHTEFLAKLSGTKRFEMMLVGGPLRTVLVTRHTPIRRVAGILSIKRIQDCILTADSELRKRFGIRRPRLAVCGLNPHAGEGGTIGDEEQRIIAPAVLAARRRTNAEIIGPLPPDTLFVEAYRGRYDAEICMYHDQGLIPLKMISRGGGVNVTLGLPFVRTSPDHGTAYDIADRFTADPSSMTEAIRLAELLTRRR